MIHQEDPSTANLRQLSPTLLHDLRTPLNHIIGYSEILADQAGEDGQTGYLSDLKKIQTAGHQVLALLSNREATGITVEPVAEATTAKQTSTDQQPGMILVVDDNAMNRDVLSRRLRREGYRVALAEDGRRALEALRAQSFDLVLLDVMMPDIDGYQVLSELKADDVLRHIPIIMISALDEMDSVVRCIALGAEDYLPKPFDPILLKARIAASLEKKAAHDREADLHQQLAQNYKRLEDLERLRDDLTHMIIHDLRTPLSSLISGIQTVYTMGEMNAAQAEVLDIAISSGETLLGMINGLLDVDKMESGSMELDCTLLDAKELVASALAQVGPLAEQGNLTLIQEFAQDVPYFEGDEDKLRRTLVNLLGNAIKFTPSGGTVTVGVRAGEDKESVLFSVSDTGEGIPEEALGRIFDKFGQVASRQSGRVMSTGLGLTFCKLAVEAHGGQISVANLQDRGSVFSFDVPIKQVQDCLQTSYPAQRKSA